MKELASVSPSTNQTSVIIYNQKQNTLRHTAIRKELTEKINFVFLKITATG